MTSPILQQFAKFLLDNKIEEYTRENIRINRKLNTPILQLFSHLSEEELFKTSLEGQKIFFLQLINGTAVQEALNTIDLWVKDKLPGIPRGKIGSKDLVLVYGARKQAMRSFLAEYTTDIKLILTIVEELEDMHMVLEQAAFEAYSRIQKEILEEKNFNITENERKLKDAQAIAKLGSWEFDVLNNKVIWSDEMFKIFEYEPGEIEIDYQKYLSHIHKKDKELVESSVFNTLQTQQPYIFENRIITKNKKIKWLQARGMVTATIDGKPVRLAGTALDITAEKLAREALENKTKAVEAVNKELEAFSYTISHDLRSPLRAIDGFGKMLAEEYAETFDEEAKRLLAVIRKNATFMGTLIDDMLEFSRLNRKELHKCRFEMSELVSEVIQAQKNSDPLLKARFKILELKGCFADRPMIYQVWQNLISNAIKFSSGKDQPEIEIGSYPENSEVVYFVKDNGAGFDMQYKDKLFGVFQRLHSANEFSGTGVGLATVQRIVLRNGGRVWAEGKVNEGATFYFSLPEN